MAIAWAFVLAVRILPSATRWIVVSAPVAVPKTLEEAQKIRASISNPLKSDADLSEHLSDAVGYTVNVATFNEPFELRKLQCEFTRASGAVAGEDKAVMTFHAIKAPGGTPSSTWTGPELTGFAGGAQTFFETIAGWFSDETVMTRLKVYKAGPAITPPQLPVFDAVADEAGTSTAVPLPPQVAISVTERAGSKPHWGRFYLPSPAVAGPAAASSLKTHGRISDALTTAIANALDTYYEAMRTAETPIVVYRPPLPQRHTAEQKRLILAGAIDESTPGELPERDGSAWTVETIAIDDVYDVIRSRRWDQPLLRTLRGVGA